MQYLSLFSGVGGFELGIQQAYEDLQSRECEQVSNKSSRNGLQRQRNIHNSERRNSWVQYGVCVGYSEIDKYAIQVYNKHFNHKNYGDITKINEKKLPDFDLIVGGFPCQSFSIAGKRGGFNDTRGTLFFDIARIIREKQPRLLLLENVKGLLSHDKGNTFFTIISALDELGYDCQWQVLNSKNFGVPQNRERVFIVGHLRGTSRPEVFPIGETSREATEPTIKKKRIKSSARGFGASGSLVDEKDITPTLTQSMGTGGNNVPMVKAVLTPDRQEKRQNGRRMKDNGEPSFTLTAQDKHGIFDGCKIRRLTPKECERLQGFPDDWTKYAKVEKIKDEQGLKFAKRFTKEQIISDTQRYKMCGNAVTVNVIKEIMLKLI
jgi:DNA (cytosine-5)-methyltransferase 1